MGEHRMIANKKSVPSFATENKKQDNTPFGVARRRCVCLRVTPVCCLVKNT